MENDILGQYGHHRTTFEMWLALMKDFVGTYATKHRQLAIKFDMFKKHADVFML